jgi:hypothetical protein
MKNNNTWLLYDRCSRCTSVACCVLVICLSLAVFSLPLSLSLSLSQHEHTRTKKVVEHKDDFFSNVVHDDLMYLPRRNGADALEDYFRVLEPPHQQHSVPAWYS